MAGQAVVLHRRARPFGAALALCAVFFLLVILPSDAPAGALTVQGATEYAYDTYHDVAPKPVCDPACNVVADGMGERKASGLHARTDLRLPAELVAPTGPRTMTLSEAVMS